jgi:hypothetical protein
LSFNTPSSQTPTAIAVTLTGTYAAGDIAAVKLFSAPSQDAWDNGDAVMLGTITANTFGSPHTFSFTGLNTPYTTGNTLFFVQVQITPGAVTSHTFITSKLDFTGLTLPVTDNQTATGGTKTIS